MAPSKPRPPRLKPLRVRLSHGGEVHFHGDAATLKKVHPGAEIVSFADGSKYVAAEQDTQPEAPTFTIEPGTAPGTGGSVDANSETKADTKSAPTKGGGTKTQTKAAASGATDGGS